MDWVPLVGQCQIVRTLRTTDAREAKARAARIASDAHVIWDMLRRESMAKILGKTVDEIELTDLNRENVEAIAADMKKLTAEEREAFRDRWDDLLSELERDNQRTRVYVELDRERLKSFRDGRQRGMTEALEALGRSGPAAPQALAEPTQEADERRLMTLVQLETDYFASRDFAPKTIISNSHAFAEFHRVVGEKRISKIIAADVAAYKAHLSAKGGRRGREKAAVASVEKSLNHVRGILKWAATEAGILSENVGASVKAPKEGKKAKALPKRLPFSAEALTRIFNSPLYTGSAGPADLNTPGPYRLPEAKRLFMLCMLLTGARTEELPDATLFDIDGITYLDLRETGTKTVAGARIVPVLPELKKLGFVSWAKDQAEKGMNRPGFVGGSNS